MYLAENLERWPFDEASERAKPAATRGVILDHDQAFWSRFIIAGALDTNALNEAGYHDGQIPWITGEMERLGWL